MQDSQCSCHCHHLHVLVMSIHKSPLKSFSSSTLSSVSFVRHIWLQKSMGEIQTFLVFLWFLRVSSDSVLRWVSFQVQDNVVTEAVKAALSHDSEGITAVMLPGRFGESTAEELHCEHRLQFSVHVAGCQTAATVTVMTSRRWGAVWTNT